MVQDLVHGPGLGQVEHEEIPVVVVAGVVMIEPGHVPALIGRAHVLAVPVRDHLLAVGVDGRREEDNDVVEDLRRIEGSPARHQVVCELERHLAGGDLRGMQAAGDEQDGLALAAQPAGVFGREPGSVSQLAGDLPVGIELGQVGLGADDGHDQRLLERSRADVQDLDPGRLRGQRLEIGLDLVVVRKLPVGPDLESEKGFRARLGGQADGKNEKQRGDGAGEEPFFVHVVLLGRIGQERLF